MQVERCTASGASWIFVVRRIPIVVRSTHPAGDLSEQTVRVPGRARRHAYRRPRHTRSHTHNMSVVRSRSEKVSGTLYRHLDTLPAVPHGYPSA